ncbi:sulfur oxidation c-type cytochrome SoxX [Puniceibacterium sp. IMCC21224]|uniref:sulfur oxidation c-type cytochrome SoxX n=1 Tax=Puniceibacterium sp. IMCC21224 TaxID=1618204 RepID=UPI00064DBF13|nr:sulfur oxidation c-type cytochrome SoxX [Puniceibacterium sp. IMCC21224]KMK66150.1 monoheme cytochrome SoxX (sulfur oxidation) [Puniceibacterium sp. IMCC21224]
MKRFTTSLIAMGLSTTILSAEEIAPTAVAFDSGAIAQSLSGQPGDPASGRKIMGSRSDGNCVACHEISAMADVPFQGNIGPILDGAGDRWSEGELRGIVANAKMMFDGTMMPSFYKTEGFVRPGKAFTGKAADDTFGPLLSAQQVEDVVAYLVTLKD